VSPAAGITREDVAAWFLRLNGFFTTENFVLHPADGAVQRTDADVAAVRFPDREEVVGGTALPDHPHFRGCPRTLFVLAEVKSDLCMLNGPWSKPDDVADILRALGFPRRELEPAVDALIAKGHYIPVEGLEARVLAFGTRRSQIKAQEQYLWEDVLGFVHDRYTAFRASKKQHQQWPEVGSWLWRESERPRDAFVERMVAEVRGLEDR
jgi:hypothetical protein